METKGAVVLLIVGIGVGAGVLAVDRSLAPAAPEPDNSRIEGLSSENAELKAQIANLNGRLDALVQTSVPAPTPNVTPVPPAGPTKVELDQDALAKAVAEGIRIAFADMRGGGGPFQANGGRGGGPGGGGGAGGGADWAARREEQAREDLQTTVGLEGDKLEKTAALLKEEIAQIQTLFRDQPGDWQAARGKTDEIRAKTSEAAKALLTPEELAKFTAWREEQRNRWQGQGRGGRGGGDRNGNNDAPGVGPTPAPGGQTQAVPQDLF